MGKNRLPNNNANSARIKHQTMTDDEKHGKRERYRDKGRLKGKEQKKKLKLIKKPVPMKIFHLHICEILSNTFQSNQRMAALSGMLECRDSAYRLGRHSCLFVFISHFVCVLFSHSLVLSLFLHSLLIC